MANRARVRFFFFPLPLPTPLLPRVDLLLNVTLFFVGEVLLLLPYFNARAVLDEMTVELPLVLILLKLLFFLIGDDDLLLDDDEGGVDVPPIILEDSGVNFNTVDDFGLFSFLCVFYRWQE